MFSMSCFLLKYLWIECNVMPNLACWILQIMTNVDVDYILWLLNEICGAIFWKTDSKLVVKFMSLNILFILYELFVYSSTLKVPGKLRKLVYQNRKLRERLYTQIVTQKVNTPPKSGCEFPSQLEYYVSLLSLYFVS